jgi:hypothetical protein
MSILTFIQRKFEWFRKNPVPAQARLCQFGHAVFSGNNLCNYGHHAV